MAKIKVNAALQRIAILEKEGYVSRAVVYSKISGDEVLEFASMNSGINQGQLSAAMHAIVQEFRNHLLTGHSVELPGVGIFRVGVNSKMVETPEDVSVENITRRRIYFRPSTNIKAYLNRVSFTTTGNEDEDEEETSGTGGTGTGTGSGTGSDTGGSGTGTGDNTGGGSDTGGSGGTTPGGDDNPDGIE
jgi:predicted histone-like DNA-binding protein